MNYQRSRQKAKALPGAAMVPAGTRVAINGEAFVLAKDAHMEATDIHVVRVADLYEFANLTRWQRLVWLVTGRLS